MMLRKKSKLNIKKISRKVQFQTMNQLMKKSQQLLLNKKKIRRKLLQSMQQSAGMNYQSPLTSPLKRHQQRLTKILQKKLESSDEKEELTTSEESAASDYAVEIKVSEEEISSAPLPMPGRRPPRRHSRFQNTTRSNHSLRHLRRF